MPMINTRSTATTTTRMKNQSRSATIHIPSIYRFISVHILLFNLTIIHHQALTQARTSPKLYLNTNDPMKQIVTLESNVFKFTTNPSNVPTNQPSIHPSSLPTSLPSAGPTVSPTVLPSSYPSITPSQSPSSFPTVTASNSPSSSPSNLPSILPTNQPSPIPSIPPSNSPSNLPSMLPSNQPSPIPSPTPTIPEPVAMTASPVDDYPIHVPNVSEAVISYFNYNPFDENYGPGQPMNQTHTWNETETTMNATMQAPDSTAAAQLTNHAMNYTFFEGNAWGKVVNPPEEQYWTKFDMGRTLGNRCENDAWRRQSPIDLCGHVVNAECLEHHQIRNRVSGCMHGCMYEWMYACMHEWMYVVLCSCFLPLAMNANKECTCMPNNREEKSTSTMPKSNSKSFPPNSESNTRPSTTAPTPTVLSSHPKQTLPTTGTATYPPCTLTSRSPPNIPFAARGLRENIRFISTTRIGNSRLCRVF